MKEIKLEEDYSTKVLKFNFLNGSFELNPKDYGAYSIATGCGAGKTTIIKQLIALKWTEGVLYAAFTKDEVNEMYRWIVDNLVGKLVSPTGITMRADDIIVLHSDSDADGVDNNMWRSNPSLIQNKKIILCTHYKLLNEPILLLIGNTFVSSSIFSPMHRALNGVGNYAPRQWILIDEGLDATPIKYRIDKSAIAPLGEIKRTKSIVQFNIAKGVMEYINVDCECYIARKSNSFSDFCSTLKDYLKFFKLGVLKPETSELDKIRNESILGELYDNFEFYAGLNSSMIDITYGISSLSLSQMSTHVLMFDGTSDITLSTSDKFKVISYPNKYNSLTNLSMIPFTLNRRVDLNKEVGMTVSLEDKIKEKINDSIDKLAEIIKKNEKTLIFTWKNLKIDNSEVNDEDDESVDNSTIVKNKKSMEINPDFNYIEYIRMGLYKSGIDPKKFSIEYYGSGLDKATNKFRNYDSVVLLGRYQVPSSVINEFNLTYHTHITGVEYYSNRVIQAICRTRIRMHQGLPINVYMTSDWSNDVIRYVKRYLDIDKESDILISDASRIDLDYMYNELRAIGITPKKAEYYTKLSMIDRNIFLALINNSVYECHLSLKEVFSWIPMSRCNPSEYRNIISSLYKLGINVKIS